MLKKVAKSSQYKFYCESCDYGSNKKINFEKHLLTKKHNAQKCSKKVAKSSQYKFYTNINKAYYVIKLFVINVKFVMKK